MISAEVEFCELIVLALELSTGEIAAVSLEEDATVIFEELGRRPRVLEEGPTVTVATKVSVVV